MDAKDPHSPGSKPEDPTPGEPASPRPDSRLTPRAARPPFQTFIFWIILLFAVPLSIFLLGHGPQPQTERMKASDFERLLKDGRIINATVTRDSETQSCSIVGSYKPEHTGSGAEKVGNEPEVRKYEVEVVYTDELDRLLRWYCDMREAKTSSNMWRNAIINMVMFLALIAVVYFLFSRQLRAAGRGALQFGKSRARLMAPNQEKVTFADVSGIAEAKEEVQEIVDYLRDPAKFQKLGGRIPKGVLMIGPPGTGKTLLARAIAGEADVPFFSISGSDFVEMFVGVGASRVRDMFEEGKRHAPCIIFIDEIDAVGRSRFSGIGGGHDEREQTLNALLVEMDGFEPNTGVIVIAATNRPDVLDAALLRPGRFDRQIAIDLPDLLGRLGILKVHAKKIKLQPDVDLEIIARGTPGFSGADLANLVNEAALLAARSNKTAVDIKDLEEARDKVRWGKERRSRKIDERDRRITAFHEAGHALVGILTDNAVPIHKVTIIPRGTAYLGATMHLPENDRYTQSRSELLTELAVLMGGRVAEQLTFGDITSGAAADIHQATDIAKKMVCQWGMSSRMGPLSYVGREGQQVFLGRDIGRGQDHSEATGRDIDTEVRDLVLGAETQARTLLTDNSDKLERLGNTLLERETLSAAEIRELLGLPDRPAASSPAAQPPAPAPDPAPTS